MQENWADRGYAERYNRLYATPAEEFRACLELLDLGAEDSLVDFGCGDGDFLALASQVVRTAVGVDVSGPQADAAERKLAGSPGVEIVRSSFLDFQPGARRFTRGFSRKALHHLTDPEKARFLENVGPSFLPGARFLLEDGMFFGFERAAMEDRWESLVEEAAVYYGSAWESKKDDVLHSFREEYPTGAAEWERIFAKSGFQVIRRIPRCSFYGALLAVKTRAEDQEDHE